MRCEHLLPALAVIHWLALHGSYSNSLIVAYLGERAILGWCLPMLECGYYIPIPLGYYTHIL